MLKKSLHFMIFLFLVTFCTQSYALVTTWDYTVSGAFSNPVFVPGMDDTDSILNGEYSTSPTSLTWGDPAEILQSGLSITPNSVSSTVNTYTAGGIPTSAFIASSISMVHDNFPIWSDSDRLSSTTLMTSVSLDPLIPDNAPLALQNFTFDLKFVETLNSGPHPNDIFAVLGGFPNFNFIYDDGIESLQYFVNVFPSDGTVLQTLTAEQAGLVGVPIGTSGFTTQENQSTTLPFAFTISTRPINPVPEPSTFFLFGCGLIGFAFLAKRRKK